MPGFFFGNSIMSVKYKNDTDDGVVLRLVIQPGAKKTEVSGQLGERLKIRVSSPPVDGKANKELIKFLSKQIGISKSKVKIIRGEQSRQKDVFIAGVVSSQLKLFI